MMALINGHSGLAGNMFLGALIDAGVPLNYLKTNLSSLGLNNWEIIITTQNINAIKTTSATVTQTEDHHHRNINTIKKIITESSLPESVKEKSIKAFQLLAEAEAHAHGCSLEKVHFHEVGAIDCIIDITGTFLALDYLKVDQYFATPINLGGGVAKCQHGTIPVPVPAVAHLLRGMPVFSNTHQVELTTPTGAAILATLEPSFEPISLASIKTFGYGAGSYKYENANYLSITIMEQTSQSTPENIVEIETNIDDLNPEIYDYLIDKLLIMGAVDVFLTPIIMKKSRPAIKLSVLCKSSSLPGICQEIFRQTGSFGVRIAVKERIMLESSFTSIATEWGPVKYRTGKFDNAVMSVKPEYEDCKKIAEKNNLPLTMLYKKLLQKGESLYDNNN